ncbi:MAG: hypothetical protein ACI9W4_002360 [Rhodothermales bacterium]|jgi:hypothetical protein
MIRVLLLTALFVGTPTSGRTPTSPVKSITAGPLTVSSSVEYVHQHLQAWSYGHTTAWPFATIEFSGPAQR